MHMLLWICMCDCDQLRRKRNKQVSARNYTYICIHKKNKRKLKVNLSRFECSHFKKFAYLFNLKKLEYKILKKWLPQQKE